MAIVTLTTDFGTRDAFVGVMKGVMLSIVPDLRIVDLSHEVPPQDLYEATYLLESAVRFFPRGTVHCAVIDPGVGSARHALAIDAGDYLLVGPDNGLFSALLAGRGRYQAYRVTNPKYRRRNVSSTFHGRDIFGPAAAYLAGGVPIKEMGDPTDTLSWLQLPEPVETPTGIEAHVVRIDGFGNLVTDATADQYQRWTGVRGKLSITIASIAIGGVNMSYSDVQPGDPVAYFGSTNRLEIAVRNGNAAKTLNARRGTVVRIG